LTVFWYQGASSFDVGVLHHQAVNSFCRRRSWLPGVSLFLPSLIFFSAPFLRRKRKAGLDKANDKEDNEM
jgi:hypothetical protein